MEREKLKVEVCEGCEKLVKEQHVAHGRQETWYTCNLWKGLPEPKSDFEKQDAPSHYGCTRYNRVNCTQCNASDAIGKIKRVYGRFVPCDDDFDGK